MDKSLIILVLAAALVFALLLAMISVISAEPAPDSAGTIEHNDENTELYFCPRDDCAAKLTELIERADKIHCALYNIDISHLISIFDDKYNAGNDVQLVTDKTSKVKRDYIRKNKGSQLMHDKFCIFDDSMVFTGSFNPTEQGAYHDNNNMIVLHSKNIAKAYESEFSELWQGIFGAGERSNQNIFYLNDVRHSVYFCPEDFCTNKVMAELSEANESIYFMLFSFTSDDIGNMLISKASQGIAVKGVMEKSQANNEYSEYSRLKQADIDVVLDTNPKYMHHKVFVVDNKTVITGSFNPSSNAEFRNDENILIVEDKGIAERYLYEFNYIKDTWT